MKQEPRLAHSGLAHHNWGLHILLIEANHFIVGEKLVLITCDRGDCRKQVLLHILNVEHVRYQFFDAGHLDQAPGDHRQVFL